jgi:tRNA threonylcarbamoyladenosine biosynthesis protein TsaE
VSVREIETASPDETEALGAALGRAARGGELVGLVGDLGTGKTCLVRGLAAGLGIASEHVHSPTFVIVHEHHGGRLVLQHVDLYRLERVGDDEPLLREVLYGPGVAAVEWFDRLPAQAGEEALIVTLRHVEGDRRVIAIEARGERHTRWREAALGVHRPA